jgi:hypothetical protein
MNEVPKQRWWCLQWGIVLVIGLLGWVLIGTLLSMISRESVQSPGVSNCKQIILALKYFAKDWGAAYPDVHFPELKSANQVFRELFKAGVVPDERIFGCPESMFNPDNDIGPPPNFEKALMPGECHWMLLKNQTDVSHPRTPILIENSLNASWPPKWDVSQSWWSGATNKNRGRAWKGRQIIVARNDGSVAVEKLREDGTMDWHSPSNLDEHGKSWIDTLTPEQIAKLEYWDIEEK